MKNAGYLHFYLLSIIFVLMSFSQVTVRNVTVECNGHMQLYK